MVAYGSWRLIAYRSRESTEREQLAGHLIVGIDCEGGARVGHRFGAAAKLRFREGQV
jgi:hypothetical protein